MGRKPSKASRRNYPGSDIESIFKDSVLTIARDGEWDNSSAPYLWAGTASAVVTLAGATVAQAAAVSQADDPKTAARIWLENNPRRGFANPRTIGRTFGPSRTESGPFGTRPVQSEGSGGLIVVGGGLLVSLAIGALTLLLG